ncbi:MAG TPA: hypothetical protein VH913_18625, partial [Hyphomicrobiaceae bacterium]
MGVFDAGYDPETLARELGDLDGERVAVLVRLRSGRGFYADPPSRPDEQVGRPRRHGAKLACDDERTWWTPTAEPRAGPAPDGAGRVRAWGGGPAKRPPPPPQGRRRPWPTGHGARVLGAVERRPRHP